MTRVLRAAFIVLTAGPASLAQFGKPMEVLYRILPRGSTDASPWLHTVTWNVEGRTWCAELHWPNGWPASGHLESFDDSEGHYALKCVSVMGPDGRRQPALMKASGKYELARELNGAFAEPLDWRLPWWPWEFSGSLRSAFGGKLLNRAPEIPWKPEFGCHWIYPGETVVVGEWRIMRVLWHVGGMSGPPPMPFVLVVLHQSTGAWIALGHALPYPDAPDRGDVMRVENGSGGGVLVSWWDFESRNVGVLTGWRFSLEGREVRRQELPTRFALYTRSGAVATFADTPKAAIHVGYQEVAWHLSSWNGQGGMARAFAQSPRRYLTQWDREGAPELPVPGERPFHWAAELYVVPWKGKPVRMRLPEALALLKNGRWDVVLFRKPDKSLLAQRLVEHHRDFPHSTPPR